MAALKRIPAAMWLLIVILIAAVPLLAGAIRHDSEGGWGQGTAAWLQALGSILAILASFVVAGFQFRRAEAERRREQSDRARAVVSLAHKALGQVADRLMVAARPFSKRTHGMALREYRTTELVEALRQIDAGSLPPEMVVPFSTLRSSLYAVNARITHIYRSEEERGIPEDRRERRIRSSLIVYDDAASDYAELCRLVRVHQSAEMAPHVEPEELRKFVTGARATTGRPPAPGAAAAVSPAPAPATPPAT